MKVEDFLADLSDAVDRRRGEITQVRRVVAQFKGTILEQTAAIMAIPMLYAHWEGFVKESVELYIEFLERQSMTPIDADPTIFAFAMKKHLNRIVQSGSVANMAAFAEWALRASTCSVFFEDKSVETRSNLSFENLEDLCAPLRIDVAGLKFQSRKINALVHKRNNVAHTGRPPAANESTVESDSDLAMVLITQFEALLKITAENGAFRRSI